MKKIMICDRFALEAQMELKKNKNFEVLSYSENELANAHALIVRSKFPITKEVLEKTKDLQLIVTCTSGFDHIDLKETEKRNITVMYTPEANSTSAAELTWSLILACARHIVPAHREMKAAQWKRDPFVGFELAGKTLGIVGLGRIGQKVAGFAKAFRMKIVAFDPYQKDEVFTSHQTQRLSFEELLKQSDIVTFHVPGTFETHHMLTRVHYESLNEHAMIINTSRGTVINEDDLADALTYQQIAGAALDVFYKEPLHRDSRLMKCPNLIMTPHLGAFTEEAFLKASMQAAQQVQNYFEKNLTENTLPLKNDWGSLSFKERT
jgi:D-3-phosphoglycerate dehydrogenase